MDRNKYGACRTERRKREKPQLGRAIDHHHVVAIVDAFECLRDAREKQVAQLTVGCREHPGSCVFEFVKFEVPRDKIQRGEIR